MDYNAFYFEAPKFSTKWEEHMGFWVSVVDLNGNEREEYLTLSRIDTMHPDDRVLLEFGPHNQSNSREIFDMWLRSYTQQFCIDFLCYEDWRKIEKGKKDAAWEDIQMKFYFEASKYKKFVMKILSKECKAYKMWLMKHYGRETLEETIAHGPDHISEEKWSAFVHLQFSDEIKRLQKGKRHRSTEPIREASSIEKMDNNDFHVEETKAVKEDRKRGKWVVEVRDKKGNVREEYLTARDLWDLEDGRVILEFGPHNQPEGGSGGIFATWLGLYSIGFCINSLCYEDWRKIERGKKDDAWEDIQKKFYFDASNEKYKKFVMKSLSQKCKAHKIWLMNNYRRETLEETIANGPRCITKDDWSTFVHLQFSDEKKKVRERNAKSRSRYKTPHTLGSKSFARKSKEILLQEGKRPSRAKMFVLSRLKSDESFVNEEARNFSEKLKEKMTQNTGNTSENNITSSTDDIFAEVFGAERPGRVRCVGLGPTPSTFFQNNKASTSTETEVTDLRNRVTYLENKLERLDELEALIASMKGTNG